MFNERELGTVLAALRHWQSTMNRHELEPEWDIATNAGACRPLNQQEIDKLCERLNSSDEVLEVAKELLAIADDSDVRQLYSEKGEQAFIHRVINRARKAVRVSS